MNSKIFTGMAIVGVTEKMFLDVSSYIAVISDMVVKNDCAEVAPKLIEGLRNITNKTTDKIDNIDAKNVLTNYIESYIELTESGIEENKERMQEALLSYDKSLEEMNGYFIGLCK